MPSGPLTPQEKRKLEEEWELKKCEIMASGALTCVFVLFLWFVWAGMAISIGTPGVAVGNMKTPFFLLMGGCIAVWGFVAFLDGGYKKAWDYIRPGRRLWAHWLLQEYAGAPGTLEEPAELIEKPKGADAGA